MTSREVLNMDFNSLVDEFIATTGMSGNALSKAIGVSPAQFSQLKNGKYKDVDGTEEKARAFIKIELEKLENKKSFVHKKIPFGFIKDTSGKIKSSLQKNKIVLLRGDSGAGKTTLLKAFKKEYPNNISIQAYKGMKKSELIREISGSTKSVSMKEIVSKVKGKILILDEANKLSGGSLEWLRSLHDMSNMPMLWAGTHEDISDVLYKQPELNRRCRKVYLKNLEDDEVRVLVESFEFQNSKEYAELLCLYFKGQMGLCVEILNEMKWLVLEKGDSADSVEQFKKVIDLMA